MSIGKQEWKACRLEDPISGEIVKHVGSEVAINMKAFSARIVKVH
jgi:hypothetical protein